MFNRLWGWLAAAATALLSAVLHFRRQRDVARDKVEAKEAKAEATERTREVERDAAEKQAEARKQAAEKQTEDTQRPDGNRPSGSFRR